MWASTREDLGRTQEEVVRESTAATFLSGLVRRPLYSSLSASQLSMLDDPVSLLKGSVRHLAGRNQPRIKGAVLLNSRRRTKEESGDRGSTMKRGCGN